MLISLSFAYVLSTSLRKDTNVPLYIHVHMYMYIYDCISSNITVVASGIFHRPFVMK